MPYPAIDAVADNRVFFADFQARRPVPAEVFVGARNNHNDTTYTAAPSATTA